MSITLTMRDESVGGEPAHERTLEFPVEQMSARELIQGENPKHRLSDDELARLLTARGIPMARRTVTKYREEMGIGSSRER